MVAVGVEWREFERTDLVDRITTSLRAGRSVLLDGEAGVGKTTVARQSAPEESVWLQGLEGLASVSLAPFSLVAADPPLDSVAAAYRWLRVQADAGVTLVVDDAQWLDPVSAGLLTQAISNDQIRSIVSVRSGHVTGEDLARAVAGFDRLTVEPLERSMVELALELALEDEPGADVVEMFAQRSGGNPLYLRELVIAALMNGSLLREAGVWKVTRAPVASANLAQLIDARLAQVESVVRRAVELVVVGEHLPVVLLAELVEPVHVAAAIEAALLREDGREIYPGHPTIGDAVAETLSVARRSSYMRELVDASAFVAGPDLKVRRLLWQLDLAGVPTESELDAGYAAAVLASNLAAAGRFAAAAHEHYPSVVNGLRAANQLHREAKHRDATRLVESLPPLAASADEAALVASHLIRTQGRMGLHLGTSPDAGPLRADIIDWADQQLEGAPFAAFTSLADAFSAGDIAGALAQCEPLLDHPTAIVRYDARERMMAFNLLVDEREVFKYAMLLDQVDDPYVRDRPQLSRSLLWVSRSVGQVSESYDRTRAAFERLDDIADTAASAVAQSHAFMAFITGRISEALDAANIAHSLTPQGAWNASGVDLVRSLCLSCAGRPDLAGEAMSNALETARVSGLAIHVEMLEVHSCFHTAAYGGDSEALDELRTHAAQRGSFSESHALFARTRLGDVDASLVERLDELALASLYAAAMALWARAQLDRDPEAMCDAADRFEEIGTLPEAVEAVAVAIDVYQSGENQAAARQLARRHQDLLTRCPGLRWPLASIAVDAPDLTRRERQVAELAALGWSNRQVGAELSISVRTVENNLQRAYSKLGIRRRGDLAGALGLQAA